MRTFGLSCLLLFTLLVSSCGDVFVRASWNGGTQTVTGMVSIVQLTIVGDGTQITVVTLADNFGSFTESFCGDQRTRFPFNNFVRATFQPGQPCSSLFNVVIVVN